MATPGMTPPCASAIAPWIVPLDCARAGSAVVRTAAKTRKPNDGNRNERSRVISHFSFKRADVCGSGGDYRQINTKGVAALRSHALFLRTILFSGSYSVGF